MAKKSNFNKNRVQARNWDITTYVSKDVIETALNEHLDIIRCYAFIYHDRFTDVELGDKTSKEPHFHIVVRCTRPLNLTTVCNWFRSYDDNGVRINTRAIPCQDFQDRYEYLIHKNDPDKFQYTWSDVIGYNEYLFRNSKNPDEDIAIDALNDLLNNVSVYDVCMRYGRDVIYHFSQLKFVFDLIYYGREFDEVKNKCSMLDKNRPLKDVNHVFQNVEHIDIFK